MHVALVSETYPPDINGVALTVQGLESGLRALGHRVSLVRPRQPAEPAPAHGPDAMLTRGAAIPRYPSLRFGLPATGTLQTRWSMDRPDAVYIATEGPLGWSALRAAERLGLPVATGFHTRFDDFVQHYGAGVLTPLVFAWMRRFHNRAHATLVPTRELQALLLARGFRHPRLLVRAVDTGQFDPALRSAALRRRWGVQDDALAVLYFGRIAPEKNLALAIEAFRALQTRRPDARMVWIGDGPARAAIEAAHPDFVFCGMRRGTDLAAHVASGDLFLFPSLTDTFGNVTLEAMASGVPTVAFDYGAAREHLVDGAHGAAVPVGDRAAFIDAACRLAGDAALRARMAPAARAAVAALQPASVAQAFAALLDGLRSRREAA